MQCSLREHLCFSPNIPLPGGEPSVNHVDEESSRIWTLDPHQLTENQVSIRFRFPQGHIIIETRLPIFQDGFDLDVDVPKAARKFCYERFLSGNELDIQGDHQREALDVVITGEVTFFLLELYFLCLTYANLTRHYQTMTKRGGHTNLQDEFAFKMG